MFSILVLLLFHSCSACDVEMNLTRFLLRPTVYDKLVRPARDHREVTTVSFDLSLAQLIDVDEKNQIITTNQWLTMSWLDPKLIWHPSDWDNVSLIHIRHDRVWLPDIVLYNNADNLASLSQISTNVMISHDGTVTWLSTGIFRSSCSIDVRYFPFDEQNCSLKFASWTYDSARIDLLQKSNIGDLTNLMVNSEWEIVKLHVKKNIVKYSCCPETFPDLTYIVQMRRRPLFYVFNMILPCFLITMVAFLGFCVPSDSGEKVSIGVTTLLSMTVFLMLVTDSMPPNSDSLPLIGVYYFSAIIIVSIATAMSVASLNLYHHGKHHLHRVPRWMARLFFDFFPKLLLMNIKLPVYVDDQRRNATQLTTIDSRSTKNKLSQSNHRSDVYSNGKMILYEDHLDAERATSFAPHFSPMSDRFDNGDRSRNSPLILRSYAPFQSPVNRIHHRHIKRENSSNRVESNTIRTHQKQQLKFSIDHVHRLVDQNERRYEQQEHLNKISQEWQILSRVVDRLLVCIFLISSMFVFGVIFFQAPHLRLK